MPRETRTGPRHEKQGTELGVPCAICGRENIHLVVLSAEYVGTYRDGSFSMHAWDDYQVVECRGCQSVSFRHTSSSSEDSDVDPDTGQEVYPEKVQVYPYRLTGRRELADTFLLPPTLRSVYGETQRALQGAMPVLAGIGIRALVETICKDRGATGRNLEKKLDDLVTQGVLTADGAEILHSLRVMGNIAAHEVRPHSVQDLGVAMDVIDHALTGIYILPQRTANLPKRGKRKQ